MRVLCAPDLPEPPGGSWAFGELVVAIRISPNTLIRLLDSGELACLSPRREGRKLEIAHWSVLSLLEDRCERACARRERASRSACSRCGLVFRHSRRRLVRSSSRKLCWRCRPPHPFLGARRESWPSLPVRHKSDPRGPHGWNDLARARAVWARKLIACLRRMACPATAP